MKNRERGVMESLELSSKTSMGMGVFWVLAAVGGLGLGGCDPEDPAYLEDPTPIDCRSSAVSCADGHACLEDDQGIFLCRSTQPDAPVGGMADSGGNATPSGGAGAPDALPGGAAVDESMGGMMMGEPPGTAGDDAEMPPPVMDDDPVEMPMPTMDSGGMAATPMPSDGGAEASGGTSGPEPMAGAQPSGGAEDAIGGAGGGGPSEVPLAGQSDLGEDPGAGGVPTGGDEAGGGGEPAGGEAGLGGDEPSGGGGPAGGEAGSGVEDQAGGGDVGGVFIFDDAAGSDDGGAGGGGFGAGDEDSSAGAGEDAAGDEDSSAGAGEDAAGDDDASAGAVEDAAGGDDANVGADDDVGGEEVGDCDPRCPNCEAVDGSCLELDFVALDGGTFQMGSTETDEEQPIHSVTVVAFELMRSEVTVGQYRACVDADRCSAPVARQQTFSCNWSDTAGALENHPVNCVDWAQVQSFATWIGARLPSEAEWEYAARSGGQAQTYPWGDAPPSCDLANFSGDFCAGDDGARTSRVCTHADGYSAQGICDLAGNVYEWLGDLFHLNYDGAPDDGSAWVSIGSSCTTQCQARAIRGGSWFDGSGYLRAARRLWDLPEAQEDYLGFRLARSVP